MSRRIAREVALRTLFQMESGHVQLNKALEYALETAPLEPGFVPFAKELVDQSLAQQEDSDQIIRDKAVDWNIDRLARVDRAILRLALGELMGGTGTPPGVVINEAVELAHRYSTEESGRFINGILGSVLRSETDE